MTAPDRARLLANPHPALPPALTRSEARCNPGPASGHGGLWHAALLVLAALAVALLAGAFDVPWPLIGLVTIPFLAVAWDRKPPASKRMLRAFPRPGRIIRDRRPTLLRALIKVPPGRPRRLLQRIPTLIPPRPAVTRPLTGRPPRRPRLVRPPHRS